MPARSSVRTQPLGDDGFVIALVGEWDLFNAHDFRTALLRAVDDDGRRIIVDLSETTFLDSTTLGVLADGVKRLRQRGGSLAVVTGDRSVSRLFEITGLDRVVLLASHVADAEACLSGGDLPDAA